jgi:Bacterial Ig-like domain
MSNIQIFGNYTFSINSAANTVSLSVDEIDNKGAASGTLRVELWLTAQPWSIGGNNAGYEVALYQINVPGSPNGKLDTNQYFTSISATVPYINKPPAGTYYANFTIAEYTGASINIDNGFVIDAQGGFDTLVNIDANGNVKYVYRPTLTVQSIDVSPGSTILASSLITSITDKNNFPITSYDFRDNTVGGGYFILNGVRQAEGSWIQVATADLPNLKFISSANVGFDSVDVSVWDGYTWAAYANALVSSKQSAISTVGTYAFTINPASSTVNLSVDEIDNKGSPSGTLRLEIWLTAQPWTNSGTNTGYEVAVYQLSGSTNGKLDTNKYFSSISATVPYINKPPAGTYYANFIVAEYTGASINIDNGFVVDSQGGFDALVNVDTSGNIKYVYRPTLTVQNFEVNLSSTILASSLITSIADKNNFPITSYDFRDNTTGGGYFTLNGVRQAEGAWIQVATADLPNLKFISSSSIGVDSVDVSVWDGYTWAAYANALVSSKLLSPTISVSADKASLTAGQSTTVTFTLSAASTNFVASDVTVSGGTLANFAGSGKTFTATFTPAPNSTINGVVSVASGVFTDAAGNGNADGLDADNQVVFKVNTINGGSIAGTLVNDILVGSTGNDTVDGGLGIDTLVYTGVKANYKISASAGGFTVNSSSEGLDSLVNIERLKFADCYVGLDVGPTQSTGETALLLGAVLPGKLALDPSKQALIGTVIGLFDAGYSMPVLSGALLRLDIWSILTGQSVKAAARTLAEDTAIVNYLMTNVNGTAPDAVTLKTNADNMHSEALQGAWLSQLALSSAGQIHIGMVGLAATGVIFL